MFFQVTFLYLYLKAPTPPCSQQARPVHWGRRFACLAFDTHHKVQEYVLPVGSVHINRYPNLAPSRILNRLW